MIAKAPNKIQNSSSDEDARVITVEADIHEASESVQSFVGNDMSIDPSIQISNIVSSSSSENEKQSNSKAPVVVPNAFNSRTVVQSVGHGPLQLGTRLPAAQAYATDTLPNTEQNVAGPRRSNRTQKPTTRCSCCTDDKHSVHPGKKYEKRIRPSKRKQVLSPIVQSPQTHSISQPTTPLGTQTHFPSLGDSQRMTPPTLTLQTTQKTLTPPRQDITLEQSTNKTNVIESRDLLSMKKDNYLCFIAADGTVSSITGKNLLENGLLNKLSPTTKFTVGDVIEMGSSKQKVFGLVI